MPTKTNKKNTPKNKKKGNGVTLRTSVRDALDTFFEHLDGQSTTGLYDMVMTEVEAPLLKTVMEHAQYNQTRAAEILGLNRGTLRKKLKQYDLI